MSLLIVGYIALDTIETPFGKVKEVLGGSCVYASISSSFFTKPYIVGIVGKDFPKKYIKLLKKFNVDLKGLKIDLHGKTFRWVGHYLYELNCAETVETQLNVFKNFRPVIPDEYKSIKFLFLGNIDPELQYFVYKQMDSPYLVACDTMNYWIENKNKELKYVLKFVQMLLINEAEIRQLAEENNVLKAIKIVSKLGPKIIVVKRGEYGSICFFNGKLFVVPGYPLENVVDPTGAGDSFAGGLLGYISKCGKLNEKIFRQGIIFGTVMGSFCVEDFSIKKLAPLNLKKIYERYKEIKKFTHFTKPLSL